MSESLKIAIQLMTPPYTNQDHDSAIAIAEAALARGHEVTIFLFADAILAANARVKPVRSDRNMPKKLQELMAEKNLKVEICGICMDYRGVLKDEIIPGSTPSGLPELAELVYSSDRFINFMA
jgi:tRNA 2-thiouridine synthesizing protein D